MRIRRREFLMSYVTEFEMAALSIQLLLIAIYFMRRNYHCYTNQCYMAMLFCSTFSTVMNITSIYTIENWQNVPIALNYAVNILYLLAYNGTALLFVNYTCSVIDDKKSSRAMGAFAITAFAAELLLLSTTPITKWIINCDNGYEHGRFFWVLYVIAFLALTSVLVLFLCFRKRFNRFQSLAIILFDCATLGAIILQYFFEGVLLQSFVIALFLVLVYISLQNPDDYMDKVTGCYNQNAFFETVEKYISTKTPFTLVAFTLDDFQYINRLLGVKAANRVLDDIAALTQTKFGAERVYHLMGCRYAVLLDSKCTISADSVVSGIKESFAAPFAAENIEILLTPYICILNYPEFDVKTEDINDAIEYSFREMARNRDITVLTATSESLAQKRRESRINNIMKNAIRSNGFEVYYQPIYDTAAGKFSSAEALIRLRDDELGFISPDEFIPMAERNGMIIEIGEIVFRTVCEFLKNTDAYALGLNYIEVNLSTVQCMQENLAHHLKDIMAENNISPDRINFEITETAHSVNEGVLRKNMDLLIGEGASFSMDDYGTGFSTANYLISLPMKIVKIDKSILWPAMEDGEALVVLRHTVGMLKALHKRIVVEGVEDQNMEQLLIDMGCDYLQGYLYSKPVPSDKFLDFLRAHAKESVG